MIFVDGVGHCVALELKRERDGASALRFNLIAFLGTKDSGVSSILKVPLQAPSNRVVKLLNCQERRSEGVRGPV